MRIGRTELLLRGPIADKVTEVNDTLMSENDHMLNLTELKDTIWARLPTGITDLEVGPHGYLYVVTAVLDAQGI